MPIFLKIVGMEQAIANLELLPRKVAFKHLRIALNAAGGKIAKAASALAQRDSGLLAKSIGVKAKIPDASWDVRHHGKPAYVVIGPKRRQGRFIKVKTGRSFAKANQLLKKNRESLITTGSGGKAKLDGLVKERLAVKLTKGKGIAGVKYFNPSRYAHLVEGGHAKGRGRSSARAYPFMAPAARIAGPQAMAAMAAKLALAFETEAAALPK